MSDNRDQAPFCPNIAAQATATVLEMLEHWGPNPLLAKAPEAEAAFALFYARALVTGIQRGSFCAADYERAIEAAKQDVRAAFPSSKQAAQHDMPGPAEIFEYLNTHTDEEIGAQQRERRKEWVARRLDPVERERMVRENTLMVVFRELLEATPADFVPMADAPR